MYKYVETLFVIIFGWVGISQDNLPTSEMRTPPLIGTF